MEPSRQNLAIKAWALPRKAVKWGVAAVRKAFRRLKQRYGPRYTSAMVLALVVALFVPVPGATLVAVAMIVVVAEVHLTISKSAGGGKAIGDSRRESGMSIQCDLIVQWNATPKELTALGGALWRWCNRASGKTGIFQYVDNQGLADLIAGEFPQSGQSPGRADRRGAHFWFRDEIAQDRQGAIAGLRREVPAEIIEDVVIDGTSCWRNRAGNARTPTT